MRFQQTRESVCPNAVSSQLAPLFSLPFLFLMLDSYFLVPFLLAVISLRNSWERVMVLNRILAGQLSVAEAAPRTRAEPLDTTGSAYYGRLSKEGSSRCCAREPRAQAQTGDWP